MIKTIQVLKKLLNRNLETKTIEILTYERLEMELLTKDELEALNDQFGDDYERAWDGYGLAYGYDEELEFIDLDNLACGLESWEGLNEEDYPTLFAIKKKIEPYRTYNLEFESKEEKEG